MVEGRCIKLCNEAIADSRKDINFIVQFVRKDGKPIEEYYYSTLEEAEQHFRLFSNDDSGLYKEICLLLWVGNDTKVLQKIECK